MNNFNLYNGEIGLGTWNCDNNCIAQNIESALDYGYKYIDTAWIYGNQTYIGKALRNWQINKIGNTSKNRESIKVISKIWNNVTIKKEVKIQFEFILKELNLEYLDICLIHWPFGWKNNIIFPKKSYDVVSNIDSRILEVWESLLELKENGLIKEIGVSNFGKKYLNLIKDRFQKYPMYNQLEIHPFNSQLELRSFCKKNLINIIGYSPLGSEKSNLLNNEIIKNMSLKYGVEPANILIKWSTLNSDITIPRSNKLKRIKDNFNSRKINFSNLDFNLLENMDINKRVFDAEEWCKYYSIDKKDFWE